MKLFLIVVACTASLLAAPAEKNRGGFLFFLAGPHQAPPSEVKPITEISMTRIYSLLISLTNVEPQKPLTAKGTILDPRGKIDFTFERTWVPETTNTVVGFPIISDPDDLPGLYSWKVEIDGLGTLEEKFKLLPEPPNDTPMHEQAAENAFLAFSKYWLGLDGDFFLILARPGQTGSATVTNYVSIKTGVRTQEAPPDYSPKLPYFHGSDEVPYFVEVVERDEILPSIQRVMQVKALDYDFSKTWFLTPAAELNGITYQGSGSFFFKLYRIYDASNGWSDWFEVGTGNEWRANSHLQDLPLTFSLLKRDGNWIVTGADGAKFVNGRLIQTGVKVRPSAPSREVVQQMLDRGVNYARRAIWAAAVDAREDSQQIKQETVNTFLQLRQGRVAQEAPTP